MCGRIQTFFTSRAVPRAPAFSLPTASRAAIRRWEGRRREKLRTEKASKMRTLSLLRIRARGETRVRFRKFDLIKDTSDRGSPRLLHCIQVCPTFRRRGEECLQLFRLYFAGKCVVVFSLLFRPPPPLSAYSYIFPSSSSRSCERVSDASWRSAKWKLFLCQSVTFPKIKSGDCEIVKIVLLIGGDVPPTHSEYFL